MLTHIKAELNEIELSHEKLRQFGHVVGGIFIGIGILGFVAELFRGVALYALAVGLVLVFFGALRPRVLQGAYRIWMGFAVVVGFFMGRILLAVLYFLVITPIAFVVRLWGHDALRRKQREDTYWVDYDTKGDAGIQFPY